MGAATPGDGAIVDVYWRPGCPFCASLRRGLRRRGVRVRLHNIWVDPDAAAVVRAATGGDETVPTVVVDGRALVNPSARTVAALIGSGARAGSGSSWRRRVRSDR
jgi:glutaredoxin-like protein